MKKLVLFAIIAILTTSVCAKDICYTVENMNIYLDENCKVLDKDDDGYEQIAGNFHGDNYLLYADIDDFTSMAVRVEYDENKYDSLGQYTDREVERMIEAIAEEGKMLGKASVKVTEYMSKNNVRYLRVVHKDSGDYNCTYGTYVGDNSIYIELHSDRIITQYQLGIFDNIINKIEFTGEWAELLETKPLVDEPVPVKNEEAQENNSDKNNIIIIIDIVLISMLGFGVLAFVIAKLLKRKPREHNEHLGDSYEKEYYTSSDLKKRCEYCKSELHEGDIYCPNCGRKTGREYNLESSSDKNTASLSSGMLIVIFIVFLAFTILPVAFLAYSEANYSQIKWPQVAPYLPLIVTTVFLIIPALVVRFIIVKERIGMATAFVYVAIVDIISIGIVTHLENVWHGRHALFMIICSVISYLIFRKRENAWQRFKKNIKYIAKNGLPAAYKKDRRCPFCGLFLKAGVKECPRCNGRLGLNPRLRYRTFR